MAWPEHGAMASALSEQLGEPVNRNMIDFSVNTNPYGPPPVIKEKIVEWTRTVFEYPDPRQQEMKDCLSGYLGCSADQVLPGNGGAELIYGIAKFLYRKKVLLVEPAFTEYRKALKANEADIVSINTIEESDWQWECGEIVEKLKHADAIWMCHPNNPTGKAFKPRELEKLLNYCNDTNKLMIVDEAFYDFQKAPYPLSSYVSEGYPLVLLRSLTKMFAIPGLRIGYMAAPSHIIKIVDSFLPAWNVNSIAEKAMIELVKKETFVKETAAKITEERRRVQEVINTHSSFCALSSDVNFYLIRNEELQDMRPVLVQLAKAGIHARHTYHFPGLEGKYIRLAVKTRSENDRLLSSLIRRGST